VERTDADAEGERNRNSDRRWKGHNQMQKMEGIETPTEGGKDRSRCRRWKE
jgi:hypothetical protein